MPYQLIALPCRTDNYIWLIRNETHAWVIDPSLAAPVCDYIAQHGLILADILITHHHYDHVEASPNSRLWSQGASSATPSASRG